MPAACSDYQTFSYPDGGTLASSIYFYLGFHTLDGSDVSPGVYDVLTSTTVVVNPSVEFALSDGGTSYWTGVGGTVELDSLDPNTGFTGSYDVQFVDYGSSADAGEYIGQFNVPYCQVTQ